MSYVKKMSRPRSRLRFEFLKIDMKQVELPPILNQHNRSQSPRETKPTHRRNISERISTATNQSRALDATDKLKFYENYKTFYTGHRHSLSTGQQTSDLYYIDKLEKKRLMPETIGFVRSNQNQLRLRDCGISVNRASPLAAGIYTQKHSLEYLDVGSNNFKDKGAAKITKNLDPNVIKDINFSCNNLGPRAIDKLKDMLENSDSLEQLNLTRCNLSSRSVTILFDAVAKNKTLHHLNVSHNKITDQACQSISNAIEENYYLEYIDLQYNNIRGVGGIKIFQGLQENRCLIDLNLSWNSLGAQVESWADAFGIAVQMNKKLRHLDISYNKFTMEEIELIGEGLKANHTILGIHVEGNQGYYDHKGYLIPKEQKLRPETVLQSTRHIGLRTNCWICENWNQIKVKFSPKELGWSGKFMNMFAVRKKQAEPVFLHLDIDDWEPFFMPKHPESDQYEAVRAVPPGKFRLPQFFISYRGRPKISESYDIVEIDQPIKKEMVFSETNTKDMQIVIVQSIELSEVNANDQLNFTVLPRSDSDVPDFAADMTHAEWTLEKSMFKDMLVSDEMYDSCFKSDIMNSRINNCTSNIKSREEMKTVLRSQYPLIMESYKYFASKSYKQENVYLSYKDVLQFLNELGLVDGKTFRKFDYDSIFKAVNFTDNETDLNPDFGVVRYEFLETIVRVAIEKFKNKGSCQSEAEAVKKMLDEITPQLEIYDGNLWRYQRYFTENMEIVYRTYMPVFQQLYNKYKEAEVGNKAAFITQEGFRDVCSDLGILNAQTAKKQTYKYFHRSMQPQVDEISQARHMKMSFMEFLEALARAIDHCQQLPILTGVHAHWYIQEDLDPDKWGVDMKIEAMIPNLLKLIKFKDSPEPLRLDKTADKTTMRNVDLKNANEIRIK